MAQEPRTSGPEGKAVPFHAIQSQGLQTLESWASSLILLSGPSIPCYGSPPNSWTENCLQSSAVPVPSSVPVPMPLHTILSTHKDLKASLPRLAWEEGKGGRWNRIGPRRAAVFQPLCGRDTPTGVL